MRNIALHPTVLHSPQAVAELERATGMVAVVNNMRPTLAPPLTPRERHTNEAITEFVTAMKDGRKYLPNHSAGAYGHLLMASCCAIAKITGCAAYELLAEIEAHHASNTGER